MAAANLQDAWARLLIDSLVEAGVRAAVISPGSRSTPFVLAAHANRRLRCRDLIDERAAAFYALGQGKVSGRPSLLIATSGTAGANYLPAVVEAGAAHAPLLVLTADRPLELQACGANQTVDQVKLYGDHARAFYELGVADSAPAALAALRRTAAQAVFRCRHPLPGAVHLNARARAPLEPADDRSAAGRALASTVAGLRARPLTAAYAPQRCADPAALDALAAEIAASEAGLVVCGPGPLEQAAARDAVWSLAARTGYPLLADAASQWRFGADPTSEGGPVLVGGADVLWRTETFRDRVRPALVVQIGPPPTSSHWPAFLAAHPGCRHWVLSAHGWPDPQATAAGLVVADLGPAIAALDAAVAAAGVDRRSPSAWAVRWQRAEAAVQRLATAQLAADAAALSEGAVARTVVESLPAGALLALGNSLPIRQVDTWAGHAAAGRGRSELAVLCQRGASGIDGLVAGAAGAAQASGRPSALLIGDVSFLHDLSGLGAAAGLEVPLAVVVVQNRGGRIFEQLPLAEHPAGQGAVLDHWLTPHQADLGAAAAVHGLPFVRCNRPAALRAALRSALARPGCTVIEAVVPPHGALAQNRALWQAAAGALESA